MSLSKRVSRNKKRTSRNPKRNTRRHDWVVSPEAILHRAVLAGLITIDEWHSPKFVAAAESAAQHLRESWPEGAGFGSSDFTSLLIDFLDEAGVKTAWTGPRGSLERVTKNLGRKRASRTPKRVSRNKKRTSRRAR